jgi:hypothetical protein
VPAHGSAASGSSGSSLFQVGSVRRALPHPSRYRARPRVRVQAKLKSKGNGQDRCTRNGRAERVRIPTGPGCGRERWRPAAKVRKQSGGLAAGRPFSSDFGRIVSGELPKCGNAGLDWQLAGAPPVSRPAAARPRRRPVTPAATPPRPRRAPPSRHRPYLRDQIRMARLIVRKLNLQPLPTRDS